MKKNPFDVVGNLFIEETEIKSSEAYIINRILSYQPQTILSAIQMNKFTGRLPSWATTALFNLVVKKQKNKPVLKFIKNKKIESPILLNKMSRALGCNRKHARQSIDIIRAQGISAETFFGLKKGE